jgi:hypothetical protein
MWCIWPDSVIWSEWVSVWWILKNTLSLFTGLGFKIPCKKQKSMNNLLPISQKQCFSTFSFLDYKLSPCVKCNMFSFGCFAGVWVLIAWPGSGRSVAPPPTCLKPVRYKYPTHPSPCHTSSKCLWRWNRYSVPKRRLLALRRRGNTQKKTYYLPLVCFLYTNIVIGATCFFPSTVWLEDLIELSSRFCAPMQWRVWVMCVCSWDDPVNLQSHCKQAKIQGWVYRTFFI